MTVLSTSSQGERKEKKRKDYAGSESTTYMN